MHGFCWPGGARQAEAAGVTIKENAGELETEQNKDPSQPAMARSGFTLEHFEEGLHPVEGGEDGPQGDKGEDGEQN